MSPLLTSTSFFTLVYPARLRHLIALCLLLVCGNSLIGATFIEKAQERKRADRKEVLYQYKTEKQASYKIYNIMLGRIIKSCAKAGLVEQANTYYRELKRNDPFFEDLAELKEDIAGAKDKPDENKLKSIAKDYQRAQEKYAKVLIPFTAQLIEKQLYGLAYDNIQQILFCDPDNKIIREYVGHEYNRQTKTWMNEYSDTRLDKDGLIWNRDLGWVLFKKQDDYKNGQHYDYTTNSWGDIKELNKLHSTLENPWPIETQHYEIYAACDLAVGVKAANELEGLYQAWIRDFVSFFGNLAMERLFDRTASPRKLKVYIFSNQNDFLTYARQKKIFDPIVAESVGFYSARLTSSQFFLSDGWVSTLWHEVTHQLFGENCNQGGSQRTALAEGLAVYMEYGRIEDGQIVIDMKENEDIQRIRSVVSEGKLPKFYDIWNLTREQFHGTHRGLNYSLGGLCVFFMMQYQDGLYATDFIDFTTESHQFPKEGGQLHEYLGISIAELEKNFKEWATEQLK